jgi:hypothetical protein
MYSSQKKKKKKPRTNKKKSSNLPLPNTQSPKIPSPNLPSPPCYRPSFDQPIHSPISFYFHTTALQMFPFNPFSSQPMRFFHNQYQPTPRPNVDVDPFETV